MLPRNVGVALLGDSWDTAATCWCRWRSTGLHVVLSTAREWLRVFSAAKVGLGVQLWLAPLTLIAGTVGAVVDNAREEQRSCRSRCCGPLFLWWKRFERVAHRQPAVARD